MTKKQEIKFAEQSKIYENGGHKPIIETMLNTAALALTAAGTNFLIFEERYFGFLLILFGAGLEYFKYAGRKQKLW